MSLVIPRMRRCFLKWPCPVIRAITCFTWPRPNLISLLVKWAVESVSILCCLVLVQRSHAMADSPASWIICWSGDGWLFILCRSTDHIQRMAAVLSFSRLVRTLVAVCTCITCMAWYLKVTQARQFRKSQVSCEHPGKQTTLLLVSHSCIWHYLIW